MTAAIPIKKAAQAVLSGKKICQVPSCMLRIVSPVCRMRMIAMKPQHRLSKVKRLGICFMLAGVSFFDRGCVTSDK
jgi:hypothetical protein